MKKILTILILLFSFKAISQPLVGRAGAANTVRDARLATLYNFSVPSYVDSNAANLQIGLGLVGSLFWSTSDSSLYARQKSLYGAFWFKIGAAGGGATGAFWNLTGNYVPVTPAGLGIGLNDPFNDLNFKTNNLTRVTLPVGGLARQVTTGAFKYMLYDTTNKTWGYGDGSSATGTVISVSGLSPLFTVSNATTTPTFAQISQSQNLVFASPNGSAGNPTFRALVAGDLPNVSSLVRVQRGILNPDSLQLASYYRSLVSSNEQSSYVTNLAWVQQTATYPYIWIDGSSSFFINDTLFLVGGFDGAATVTDSIHFSTDLGINWGAYSKKFPYALANVTSIKARYPGDWNYIFGITGAGNTNKRTVTRFKDFTQFYTMTTTAEWGNQYLYGVDVDDDGVLYLVGGQTDNADTLTATKDVWISTAQSGGANWTQVQTDVQKIGGCLINQVRYRDGYLYVLNSGNKMGSVSAYTSTALKIPITQIRDSTKWVYVDNAPASVGGQLFTSSVVYKGQIFHGFGSDGTNHNGVAYLDRYDKWHTYYNYTGIDSTGATDLEASHASDFIVAKNSLIKTLGQGSTQVLRLSDTTFSTPGQFRQSVKIANSVYASETLGGQGAIWGRGVVASTITNDQIVRKTTDAFNPYYRQSFTGGHLWGGLTTSNSTINTPIAVATGTQMQLDVNGMLSIGSAASAAGTRLYTYGNVHFDGNNTNAPITFSHNGSSPTGVMTGVSGQAWYGSASGVDTRFFSGNSTPNMVLTSTGLQVGTNTTATNTFHVNGSVRLVTGSESDGDLFMSSSTGVGDWTNSLSGIYTIGSSGSAAGPRLIVWAGAQFLGNNIGASLAWGQTTNLGVLTYSGSDAWVGGSVGAKLKLFAQNGTPNVVLTTTGLNIGSNADASSYLTLAAGTASANTAPLKYTTGSLLTVIEPLTREANASSLYGSTVALNRYAEGGAIKDFIATVDNVGTGETDLFTYTTKASTLDADGMKLNFNIGGTFNDLTATAQLQFYFGGTNVGNTGALTVSAIGGWSANVFVIRTSSTTVRTLVTVTTPGASTAVYTTQTDVTGLTLSNTNIIKITGTAAGASGGNGDISAKLGTIYLYGAANN